MNTLLAIFTLFHMVNIAFPSITTHKKVTAAKYVIFALYILKSTHTNSISMKFYFQKSQKFATYILSLIWLSDRYWNNLEYEYHIVLFSSLIEGVCRDKELSWNSTEMMTVTHINYLVNCSNADEQVLTR